MYGTLPVSTEVTLENAIETAASIPSGCSTSHSGPSADCLYLALTSRRPSMNPTCRLVQRSDRRTRRRLGTATRRLGLTSPTEAPPRSADAGSVCVELGLMWTGSLGGTGHHDHGGVTPALVDAGSLAPAGPSVSRAGRGIAARTRRD